jgi:organic radical activating enzyme
MIKLEHAEVTWALNSQCSLQCSYCRPEWKAGSNDRTIDQYLSIVDKLQNTRYQHHKKIYWKLTGGEPLDFPDLSTLLKKIKEKPSIVQLETSGDVTWFAFLRILKLIDQVQLTYHYWQNDDVFDFILEQCQENNIQVCITVPLVPGNILESREKIKQFIAKGYLCNEQILRDANGDLYRGYSQLDDNRIHGRVDDFKSEPVIINPNVPDPRYIDLRIVNNTDPVYTGQDCYAGVDWIYINHKGFVSYSQCGGRNEHLNAFDPEWQPPASAFPCTVNQCRSHSDRSKIRIVGT